MSSRATVLSLLALGLLGTGAWTAWRLGQGEPVDAGEQPAEQPTEQPAADAGAAVASKPTLLPVLLKGDVLPPKPQDSPRDISAMMRLPDGTYIPNLNGVQVPMAWSRAAFSPIVGIRRSDLGVDWWVHENGTLSTTVVSEGIINGVRARQAALQIAVPLDKTFPTGPGHPPKHPPARKN